MCIIVIKEKGVDLPKEQIFKNCFSNNPDGAGFMYNKDGKVIIQKGFMKYKDFKNALDKATSEIKDVKNTGMVFHFRITTQGGTNPQNCHPFPLSAEENDLRSTYFETNLGIAHNGIISLTSGYSSYYYYGAKVYDKDSHLSDTQIFIRDYLYPISKLNPDFYNDAYGLDLVELLIESKMCFLNEDGDITYVGSFTIDKEILYSNESYKTKRKIYTLPDKKSKNKTNGYSKKQWDRWSDEIDEYDDYDDDYYDGYNYTGYNTGVKTTQKYMMPITVDAYWYDNDGDGDVIEAGRGAIDFSGYVYIIDEEKKTAIQASSIPVAAVKEINGDKEIKYNYQNGKSYTLI